MGTLAGIKPGPIEREEPMKLTLWIDVYQWTAPTGPFLVHSAPPSYMVDNGKRYRIDVEVSDPVDVDGVTEAVATKEDEC